MADTRFFTKSKSFTVGALAEMLGYTVSDGTDTSLVIEDVAPLKNAQPNHLSFLDNIKYKEDFINTKAGVCLVSQKMAILAPENLICLVTPTPYKAYALAAQAFYPEVKPENNISSFASIDNSAKIGDGASIAPHVHIEANVKIGKNIWIEAGAVIQDGVTIGDNCRIGAQTSVSHALIGDYVRLYPGVRVGQDGFGFAIDPNGHVKVPQLGRVIIEDHVEIGANTTIDRGSGPDTIIGQGTWIDNLVQIGHNVVIGKGCVIVSQVGISGSCVIGDFVAIGGQAGIAGHLHIGAGAKIGAQSGVINDLEGEQEYIGSPAFPKTQYFRQIAALNRLIKKRKRD
ncbi:MAG: UDP-3-O-(3-hydroxymyristoyl)glucosamine N-acyltransferase [Alphaproteobacteria bacterium]|nr:UDP-3-O-(3-hydroxymyristoyl)glucosamine N-acyltransferase [Alphaproteobacteria bacterium]